MLDHVIDTKPVHLQPAHLEEWRCWNCNRLIARMILPPGSIVEIKCRCNYVNCRQVVPMIKQDGASLT